MYLMLVLPMILSQTATVNSKLKELELMNISLNTSNAMVYLADLVKADIS